MLLKPAGNYANSGSVPDWTISNLFASGEQGAWYDPSDLSTLWQDVARTIPVIADGDLVAVMDDKSGNGNHLSQAILAKRPLYKAFGGLHWLEFDGVDDCLATVNTPWSGSDEVSSFVAVYKPSDATNQIIFEHSADTNTNNGCFHLFSLATNQYRHTSKGTLGAWVEHSRPAPATDVITSQSDILSDSIEMRTGGVSRGVVALDQGGAAYVSAPFFVGMRGGTIYPFGGKIFGLVTRSRLSSSVDIGAAENYLATKSGVNL